MKLKIFNVVFALSCLTSQAQAGILCTAECRIGGEEVLFIHPYSWPDAEYAFIRCEDDENGTMVHFKPEAAGSTTGWACTRGFRKTEQISTYAATKSDALLNFRNQCENIYKIERDGTFPSPQTYRYGETTNLTCEN
jgi:hypothetical protein